MPLELSGSIITGIRVEFAGGRAVKIDADTGADALRAVAARDDGASRLGEIALVDGEGRIGPLGPSSTTRSSTRTPRRTSRSATATTIRSRTPRSKARVNQSRVHVDFMIGSPELAVDGITRDGDAVPVLRDGAWQI